MAAEADIDGRAGDLRRRGPPGSHGARTAGLVPWLFAALFSVVGFFLILALLGDEDGGPLKDRRMAYDLELIEAFRRSEAPYKVAILGNSRLRYATFDERELAAVVARQGLEVAFVRLFKNNAVFRDFDYALQPLLDAGPDIVVVQAPLLVQEPGDAKYGLIPQYIRWRLVGGTIDGVDPHEVQHALICHQDVSARIHTEYTERIKRRRSYDAAGENARAADAFIARARERSIPVVVVTTPVTARLAAYLAARGSDEVIREVALPRADEAWLFEEVLPDSAFCDPMHLDLAGRRLYSEWLLGRLALWRGRDESLAASLSPGTGAPR
jgi:hypothetical protein